MVQNKCAKHEKRKYRKQPFSVEEHNRESRRRKSNYEGFSVDDCWEPVFMFREEHGIKGKMATVFHFNNEFKTSFYIKIILSKYLVHYLIYFDIY